MGRRGYGYRLSMIVVVVSVMVWSFSDYKALSGLVALIQMVSDLLGLRLFVLTEALLDNLAALRIYYLE